MWIEGGGGVTKLVNFCCCHKWMTPVWFKIIATHSIVRGVGFFSNIKPDTFWLHKEWPSHDQTKSPVTFSSHFFIWKKYCCLFNIASWLASNKTLWTRKCNRISSYNFFALNFRYHFRYQSDLNSVSWFQWPYIRRVFSTWHSYTSTESWTYTDDKFRLFMFLF